MDRHLCSTEEVPTEVAEADWDDGDRRRAAEGDEGHSWLQVEEVGAIMRAALREDAEALPAAQRAACLSKHVVVVALWQHTVLFL